MAKNKTALQKARESMGFSSRRVAEAMKIDVSGLHRIENGDVQPNRDSARHIYAFYEGVIPIGVIYDPRHTTSQSWLSEEGVDLELEQLAKRLKRQHEQLDVRVLPRTNGRARRR